MINGKTVSAIILVAGNSTRYGQNRNKNFENVNGKTVLAYSLSAFDKNTYIDDIIIATKEDEIEKVKEIVLKEKINKNVKFVIGGKTRKDSVYNCIKKSDSDLVIIHDGARPVIKQEYITNCIQDLQKYKGVTVGVKSKDTIKITDENNIVVNTTQRANTWIIQTPQAFNRKVLLGTHEKYQNSDVTDDCMLLEKDNHDVKIIEADYTNIKITTYEDINFVKDFLNN